MSKASFVKMNKEKLKEKILKEKKKYVNKIPSSILKEMSKSCQIDEVIDGGGKCYRILPNKNFDGTYVFYLYGGAMCYNITPKQWKLIAMMCKKSGYGFLVPMYPLAPENCCRDTFNMLCKCYSTLTMAYDVKKLVLMGDAAGAGLALSLTILAWKEGFRKPDQLVLISPMLDTEFFDKELEAELNEKNQGKKMYFSEASKDFINTYWVKDYAVKTEYTSPYYEDYTDICDDVVVFSGIDDVFNCYARAFYNKAKSQGLNVRFFEFDGAGHGFIFDEKNPQAANARGYLMDVLMGTYNNSLPDIYTIKLMSDWTKKYPDTFSDSWASKFIYDNKIEFGKSKRRMSEYRSILMACSYSACDRKVEKYIMEYPNCTVINVGCRLDNMFGRLDNGRIQWYSVDDHNVMSVRRSMYGEREREKTVGRDIMDFSWVDEINCVRNRGVMIVCNMALMRLTRYQFRSLLDKLHNKFPGAELVFTAVTKEAAFYSNIKKGANGTELYKLRMWVDDAYRMLGAWGACYKMISEEPILKYARELGKLKLKTKAAIRYNMITYDNKLVHVKLGGEAYEIVV